MLICLCLFVCVCIVFCMFLWNQNYMYEHQNVKFIKWPLLLIFKEPWYFIQQKMKILKVRATKFVFNIYIFLTVSNWNIKKKYFIKNSSSFDTWKFFLKKFFLNLSHKDFFLRTIWIWNKLLERTFFSHSNI